jgi:ribonuclease-3
MIKDLEKAIGYSFKNVMLLQNALTHSSYANECWHDSLKSNERLEFLGDSVLGVAVAEYLYKNFPERPEGELTKMRADMVCEQALAVIAERLDLGQHMLLGNGEEQTGGRNRASVLADAVESVIAACYLDGGAEAAKAFIDKFVLNDVPVKALHNVDFKTALQEKVQRRKNQVLTYELLSESGPDHAKTFEVAVLMNGSVWGTGVGSSKKRAEQAAAQAAYELRFHE